MSDTRHAPSALGISNPFWTSMIIQTNPGQQKESTEIEKASVSVVIPCYNQGRFLHDAIDSVRRQTHPYHEIIVVDDASPDMTGQIVKQYPDVRYVRHEYNRGLGASRNTGIRHSTGQFLVFLDADDRVLPHHFETCLKVFHERPDVALVCGDFRWFGDQGTWHQHTCSKDPDQYAALLRFGFITPPHSVMVKREVIVNLGGFKEGPRFQGSEDRDCWLRVTRLHPIYCHHEIIAEYRRHSAQMSRKWGIMLSSGVAAMREQLPYITGNTIYEEAYQSGIRQYQNACGQPLIWQMVDDARHGRWRAAAKALWIVVRLYPEGLRQLLRGKLQRVWRAIFIT